MISTERLAIRSPRDLRNTASLEGLQTEEQRRVLDVIAQLRRCNLESTLSLPQLVVCGDQSAGKSSVLEALTEIPFPRNDNLCTRFATEIILRRAELESLTIKVIPDAKRSNAEQDIIRSFVETITDFKELPGIMDKAMEVMGIGADSARAFAKDVLSIEIEGPDRPQLTLVDLPGLIQNATTGVTDEDVEMVRSITESYISQPRTICLAVISCLNDYANQGIITRIRKHDPKGERTLGIITKPDRVEKGSGSEAAFIALARNEDIRFNLGWHVLRNRNFQESHSSFAERNMVEEDFFRKSNFRVLEQDNVGIDALRARLSLLLFEHVKNELPKLRSELDGKLSETTTQLVNMGVKRSEAKECREFLTNLSLEFHGVCKSAIAGHYEGTYFQPKTKDAFSPQSTDAIRRLRALVQMMNEKFAARFRTHGHHYWIETEETKSKAKSKAKEDGSNEVESDGSKASFLKNMTPIILTEPEAIKWVKDALTRSRGRELSGTFNPLLVGELYWEQASKWRELSTDHLEDMSHICSTFLTILLKEKCPKDLYSRVRSIIQDALKERDDNAYAELERLMADLREYPINYNHYYLSEVQKKLMEKENLAFQKAVKDASTETERGEGEETHKSTHVDVGQLAKTFRKTMSGDGDMGQHSCAEILHRVIAIYKVLHKVFVQNITMQVVERHIVRGLENIFSPVTVNRMTDEEVEGIAAEPAAAKRHRAFLEDQLKKLSDGQRILKGVMRSTAA
ncbi:dynamin family protein-like protein [Mytilinidion resinicola]|uniref:Dynamin family protein-like protein n=1 Tax=Mytilinidion resinicola TaxID=574789 RepID=A0A6A6YZV2_9PEZI|nr:dynamin family protein-like protein [Mytilinidion resinicola]KAF2813497.1 dynamin family protein-like protein [Mytilinidion resinicola]